MCQNLRTKLKAARKALDLTQAEASQTWGVPLGTLICWENDQRTPRGIHLTLIHQMLDQVLSAGDQTQFSAELQSVSAASTPSELWSKSGLV